LLPQVTITLTRFAEPDALVAEAIQHALAQTGVGGEVLFLEQKQDSPLTEDYFAPGLLKLRIVRQRLAGLSAARNLALAEAQHPLVLFLDADAMAAPDWAAQLAGALIDPAVALAGSRIVPRWPGAPPVFTRASVLRDQYSLLDLGPETRSYHRVVGAGFGVDMGKLPSAFRFDETLGRRQGLLFGGEESDFCARAAALGHRIFYVGSACVEHCIAADRVRWRWILKRMVYAGHGRARVGGAPAPSGARTLGDWLLLPIYLPPYAWGWLWGRFSAPKPATPAD